MIGVRLLNLSIFVEIVAYQAYQSELKEKLLMILISLGIEVSNETLKESILAQKYQDYDDFPKPCLSGLVGLIRPHSSKKVQIFCTFKKFQT